MNHDALGPLRTAVRNCLQRPNDPAAIHAYNRLCWSRLVDEVEGLGELQFDAALSHERVHVAHTNCVLTEPSRPQREEEGEPEGQVWSLVTCGRRADLRDQAQRKRLIHELANIGEELVTGLLNRQAVYPDHVLHFGYPYLMLKHHLCRTEAYVWLYCQVPVPSAVG